MLRNALRKADRLDPDAGGRRAADADPRRAADDAPARRCRCGSRRCTTTTYVWTGRDVRGRGVRDDVDRGDVRPRRRQPR